MKTLLEYINIDSSEIIDYTGSPKDFDIMFIYNRKTRNKYDSVCIIINPDYVSNIIDDAKHIIGDVFSEDGVQTVHFDNFCRARSQKDDCIYPSITIINRKGNDTCFCYYSKENIREVLAIPNAAEVKYYKDIPWSQIEQKVKSYNIKI